MKIKGKTIFVYDIEIFPNVFHCTVKNTETGEYHMFEISERKNQIEELCKFFLSDKFFAGYNNIHYDNVIINYIISFKDKMLNLNYFIICDSLFNLSKTIVNSTEDNIDSWKTWKYQKYFESLDLLTMLFSSKLRVSLKEMQVTMQYKNVFCYGTSPI